MNKHILFSDLSGNQYCCYARDLFLGATNRQYWITAKTPNGHRAIQVDKKTWNAVSDSITR